MAKSSFQDKQNAVAEPSNAYSHMYPKWRMISTLLGGTAAMREAGSDYLPQHSAEDNDDYRRRLQQTTLYNMIELTLNSLVGRVFREPMKLNDDIPEEISNLADDIDAQGTDISTFCQGWFREAMAKGYAHVMVDMPAVSAAEKGSRTKADDLRENRRPFWTVIAPENIIFMHWESVNGVDTLVHARLVEYEVELDGFEEVCHTYIRVLTPGKWARYRNENEHEKNGKPKWVKFEEGETDLDVVPIVTFYTNKHGHCVSKPPLEDLAYMNTRHWQSTSDQINVLTVARFPMLAASGSQVENGKSSMPIGPRQLLTMRDPNGRFYYVEHTGRAISAGKEDIEMLEDRMSSYGAEFLRRQISGRTAFERNMDTNEAVSPLYIMTTIFESSVRQALDLTAKWLGLSDEKGGTVEINKQYTEEEDKASPVQVLGEARKRGDVSVRTFLVELKRHKVLDDQIDVDDEIAQLKKEAAEGPHPPTYYQAQLQVQGQLEADGEVGSDKGNNKVLPKGSKAKPKTESAV